MLSDQRTGPQSATPICYLSAHSDVRQAVICGLRVRHRDKDAAQLQRGSHAILFAKRVINHSPCDFVERLNWLAGEWFDEVCHPH